MKLLNYKYHFLSIILLLSIYGCGTYRQTQRPLLKKNHIIIHGDNQYINTDKLERFIGQKPNKSILGIWKFKLWAHQLAYRGKDRKIKKWMNRNFGEPPVFYDSFITQESLDQMRIYMNKTGHFNSKLWKELKEKKRKIKLNYHIEVADPYRINTYDYRIADTTILKMIKEIEINRLINVNDVYNEFIMQDERKRITAHLRNNGYFNLAKEYFKFIVDTAFNAKQLSIKLVLLDPEHSDLINQNKAIHKKYSINNIYINSNYDLIRKDSIVYDTLNVQVMDQDTSTRKFFNYKFLYDDEFRIKPKAITHALTLRPDNYFSQEDVQKSYQRLAEMRTYKYTNIKFTDISDSINNGTYLLDCKINLTRSPIHSYSIEFEGTNSGGVKGIGGNLVYTNRNLFKGAEIFQIRYKASLEVQQLGDVVKPTNQKNFLFFNTIETGVELSLTIPKFLIPISPEFFPKDFKPRTNISTGLNYQQRPNYRRYITNVSFGYEWSANSRTRHILFPVKLNSVKVYPTPEFDSILNEEDNIRIRNQYTNHLVPSLTYSYIYNSQNLKRLTDFIYFRADFETSAFLINAMNTLFNTPLNEDGNNTLFGIRYAQYIRAKIDFRHYNILSSDSRLVFRTIIGFGIPYGNSDDLPFEKGFYSGGANGMRAWGFRQLGPGGSSLDINNNLERIGDIRLEVNMEYRFPIHNWLKGALFVDIGNIWLLNKNSSFPDGQFNFKDFYKELALDAGFGFRFDFNFFVFRIDGALRIHDPTLAVGDRWVINDIGFGKIVWNFGIGYPF